MKLLGYCLLCLFATRVQPKPQITKLFPVEGLAAYHKQFNSTTKSVDKFWEKLRTTYNFVFRQSNNTSNVEKILTKNASDSNLQSLRLIWADTLKNHDSKANSNNLGKDSIIKIKATRKTNENNVTSMSSNEKGSNKIVLPDDDWFNDIQPLELQDEELDKKNEVEIVTPETTLQTTVGHHLLEWLGSLFGLTYSIYSKLSNAACGKEKMTQ